MVSRLLDDVIRKLEGLHPVAKPTLADSCKYAPHFHAPYVLSSSYKGSESPPEYGSESAAESAGKREFRKWRTGIEIPFKGMHSHFESLLSLKDKGPLSDLLDEVSKILDAMFQEIKENYHLELGLPSGAPIYVQEPIMEITYENTNSFFEDPYDNSTFVNTYDSCVGEGWFGSKYKYGYMFYKAREEEEKDLRKAFANSSALFFEDFYTKYMRAHSELKKSIINSLIEINTTIADTLHTSRIKRLKELDSRSLSLSSKLSDRMTQLKESLDRFGNAFERDNV